MSASAGKKILAGIQLASSTNDEFRSIAKQVAALSNGSTQLEEWLKKEDGSNEDDATTITVPLQVICAMRAILTKASKSNDNKETAAKLKQQLEACLRNSKTTQLAFYTPPAPVKTAQELKDDAKFAKRMAMLKMKNVESKYQRYTTNLDKVVEDDVTTKSMTYAASIGLNMIVAPITFGVFVYFFAGHFLFPEMSEADKAMGKINVGKVISAVIAGVAMMFIEMILFVIRSHELDTHTTRKQGLRKKEYGAFGSKAAAQMAVERQKTMALEAEQAEQTSKQQLLTE